VAGKIRGPGIALLVTNIIGVVLAAVQVAMGPDPGGMSKEYFEAFGDSGADLPDGMPEQMAEIAASMGSAGYAVTIITLLVGIFLIWGSIQMMNAQKYGIAMATAIISMIPCLGPCCILGLPFGIWALVALSDVNVKALFRQNDR
jgi:hypothetical protein